MPDTEWIAQGFEEHRVTIPADVNGGPGVVVNLDGRVVAVMAFTVANGRIVSLDTIGDPDRLGRLEITGMPA